MNLTGQNFIGNTRTAAGAATFRAANPATGELLPGDFTYATDNEITHAIELAEAAFFYYNKLTPARRADFLDAIAEEIMNIGDPLVERCTAESGLSAARIIGERGRTCTQIGLFANLLREGWYVDARIDRANPDRKPQPKPDLRRMLIPIGPVAVFGASNFPLAFSTAGGDTISALAAGCPVIVKSHSAHPGTNELVAQAIINAVQRTGMPHGVFSSLNLKRDQATALVAHPIVKAVGFTGSRTAGMHLFTTAANRAQPIPVYAEMSAINPVVLLEGALHERGPGIARDLASSVTLGAGQFCTNPGLIFLVNSTPATLFLSEFASRMCEMPAATMLTRSICDTYRKGVAMLCSSENVRLLTSPVAGNQHEAVPAAFVVEAETFLTNKSLSEELFGPATLIVVCKDAEEILYALTTLDGQLTATLHSSGSQEDQELAGNVLFRIVQKAGRVIYGGYPTGVEVSHAMQHGGPFPATTDGRSTSVGSAAIERFLRPVAFQDLPDIHLPLPLQSANPLGILRLLDGACTTDAG